MGEAYALFKIDAPTLFFFDASADGYKFVMPLPEKPSP
jgi:hypothetical protein